MFMRKSKNNVPTPREREVKHREDMEGLRNQMDNFADNPELKNLLLDCLGSNPIDDYPTNLIQELKEHLEKNGDKKTADGKSTLVVLTRELEKRKDDVK